jgi:hypothetical protein
VRRASTQRAILWCEVKERRTMGTKYRVAEKLLSFGRGKCCAVAPTGSECSIVAMLLPGRRDRFPYRKSG